MEQRCGQRRYGCSLGSEPGVGWSPRGNPRYCNGVATASLENKKGGRWAYCDKHLAEYRKDWSSTGSDAEFEAAFTITPIKPKEAR